MIDWENTKWPPEFIPEFRARYEDLVATLDAAVAAGDERKAGFLREAVARMEERARSGKAGDQPEPLTAKDEAILDEVWSAPVEDLATIAEEIN